MKSFLSLAALIVAGTLAAAQDSNPLIVEGDEVYVYTPVAPASGAAQDGSTTCNFATVKEFCGNLPGAYEELKSICRILDFTEYLSKKDNGKNSLLNKSKTFTLFLSNNKGVATLFDDVLGQANAGTTILTKFIEYSTITEEKLTTSDIECNDRLPVIFTGGLKPPKVFCRESISGTMNAYVKGKKNTKFVPKFVDPTKVFTEVCNANIYMLDNVILLDLP